MKAFTAERTGISDIIAALVHAVQTGRIVVNMRLRI